MHHNVCGVVVQVQPGATAARVSDDKGRHLEMRYDEATDTFVITAQDCNIRVETGSNKIWVTKR
jgi:hypothetical protein